MGSAVVYLIRFNSCFLHCPNSRTDCPQICSDKAKYIFIMIVREYLSYFSFRSDGGYISFMRRVFFLACYDGDNPPY
jgi:hypothetical protein